MKKFLSVLSMLFLLGSQSSIALGQTRIFRGGAAGIQDVQGSQPDGSGTLPNPILMGGDDGGTLRNVSVNASGQLEVDIVAGVSGLATEATLSSIDTELAAQGVGIGSIDTAVTSIDTKTPALGAAVTASSVPVNIASDQTVPISAASLPLPSGAATEATLATVAGAVHNQGDTATALDPGVFALTRANPGLTSITTTGEYGAIATTNVGSVLTVPTFDSAVSAALQVAKLEDTLAANGSAGIQVFGVENSGTSTRGGSGDHIAPAVTTTGASITSPIYAGSLGVGVRLINLEDITPIDFAPLMPIGAVRQDTLVAGGGTSASGDLTHIKLDNFGATWSALTGDDGARIPADADGLKVKPIDSVLEEALVELVGIDENVAVDEYGASAAATLAGTHSGEVLKVCLFSTEDGTGSILEPTGTLLVLDAATANAVGAADITAAERVTILAQIPISATAWQADANGSVQCPVIADAFHANGTLHVLWFHEDAVAYNDVGTDDEQLEVSLWYRRDS